MSGIVVSRRDSARLILLDRTEDGGRLKTVDLAALKDALLAPPEYGERAIVVSGAGQDFCTGRIPDRVTQGVSRSISIGNIAAKPILDVYDAIARAPLPVVAAVTGKAFGFGCALAGACDVAYASPSAVFALPELDKGVPPTLAMSALFGRVARRPLLEWILSGRQIDASAAQTHGLVDLIVVEPLQHALDLALKLGSVSVRSLATLKAFLNASIDSARPAQRLLAGELIGLSLSEDEAQDPALVRK